MNDRAVRILVLVVVLLVVVPLLLVAAAVAAVVAAGMMAGAGFYFVSREAAEDGRVQVVRREVAQLQMEVDRRRVESGSAPDCGSEADARARVDSTKIMLDPSRSEDQCLLDYGIGDYPSYGRFWVTNGVAHAVTDIDGDGVVAHLSWVNGTTATDPSGAR